MTKKWAPRNIQLVNTNECKDLLDDFVSLDTSFVFVQIEHKKEIKDYVTRRNRKNNINGLF